MYQKTYIFYNSPLDVRAEALMRGVRRSVLPLFLISLGLVLLLICLIPVTSVDEVINTSFAVAAGAEYGPPNFGTNYHTRIFGKSVLKGEVVAKGECIFLTVYGYNAKNLEKIYVKGRYNFIVDPAHDLYTFIFNNTEGHSESLVEFRLEEVWTRPLAVGFPPLFIGGLIGFFLFLTGIVSLAIQHFRLWRAPKDEGRISSIEI